MQLYHIVVVDFLQGAYFAWKATAMGKNFTRYKHNSKNDNSLRHNKVLAICEDSEGLLWIGTHGGLDRFDKTSRSFTHYSHNPDDVK